MDIVNTIVFLDNNKILKDIRYEGGYKYFIYDDNTEIKSKDISLNIKVLCLECNKYSKPIKLYGGTYSPLKIRHVCFSCKTKGEHNPFYGKHHTKETKQKIADNKPDISGDKNPFYGKKHTEESLRKIHDNAYVLKGKDNPFYGKTHSPELMSSIVCKGKNTVRNRSIERKKEISGKLSNFQKQLRQKDPEYYRIMKKKAGEASHTSQSNRYNVMNSIELLVNNELIKRNMNFEPSVILNHKQYDFGNKLYRILLEVHGDYWHANPNLFGEGDNKRKINNMQQKKIARDIEKKEWAESHNMKLFIIWETDIRMGNFSVIDDIQKYIAHQFLGVADTNLTLLNADKSIPPA
jgi:G:T-mismatch repair DNA endonuclease (very short patch repair protein)